jgi:chemotaxis protein histidine kinase CheA
LRFHRRASSARADPLADVQRIEGRRALKIDARMLPVVELTDVLHRRDTDDSTRGVLFVREGGLSWCWPIG